MGVVISGVSILVAGALEFGILTATTHLLRRYRWRYIAAIAVGAFSSAILGAIVGVANDESDAAFLAALILCMTLVVIFVLKGSIEMRLAEMRRE